MYSIAKQMTDDGQGNLRFLSNRVQRDLLYRKYAHLLAVNPHLNRAMVSFQSNKKAPFYRWLKYKEAFSSDFVCYILKNFKPAINSKPRILDPFAGVGTTPSTAVKEGWESTGIELLPVGAAAIKARLLAETVKIKSFEYYLRRLKSFLFESFSSNGYQFPHLRITRGAFSKETEKSLSGYIAFLNQIENRDVRFLFWFASLAVLEEVSYTRKDGQYLRWDFRSGRCLKSKFNKGHIPDFRAAITNKLDNLIEDIRNRDGGILATDVRIIEGSCLTELIKLPSDYFSLVITSPPYCNRYDYTRTYALELAYFNYDDESIKRLRQTLLSATVENKTKYDQLVNEYKSQNEIDRFNLADSSFNDQQALHEVLNLLYMARQEGNLNNNNIPNLVHNYFFEMNIVIHELSRVLAPSGRIVMVNDNVQYNGEEIPVDLILSDFAANAGLEVENIWILSKGKGNSSQQMGTYGRNEIRKCVYVWRKPR